MKKPKGYRICRIDPFPRGRIGVGIVRPIQHDSEYSIAVFMPPIKGVTIDVPVAGGRVEVDTDGMIPVMARIGHSWGNGPHLFLMDKDKQLAPFSIANVYDDGAVCWGNEGNPRNMRACWDEFWTRPFNTDLTDIPAPDLERGPSFSDWLGGDDSHGYEEDLYELQQRISKRWQAAAKRAVLGCTSEYDRSKVPATAHMVFDTNHIYKMISPPRFNMAESSRFTPHDHIYNRYRSMWPSIEQRRRDVAARRGVAWSGAAAHDQTWRTFRTRHDLMETLVSTEDNDKLWKRAEALVDAVYAHLDRARQNLRFIGEALGDHLISCTDAEMRTRMDRVGIEEPLKIVNEMLDGAVAKARNEAKCPRWLLAYLRTWFARWAKLALWRYASDFIDATIDRRMRVHFDRWCDEHPLDDDTSERDEAIHNHFHGGEWKNTLEFRNYDGRLGSLERSEFVPPDKYEGIVTIPYAVIQHLCKFHLWKDLFDKHSTSVIEFLRPSQRLPSVVYYERIHQNATVCDLSVSMMPFLGRRYKDTSVYLIEPIHRKDYLFLYDGRWRIEYVGGKSVEEIDAIAQRLDSTEFWGVGSPAFGPGELAWYEERFPGQYGMVELTAHERAAVEQYVGRYREPFEDKYDSDTLSETPNQEAML